MKKILQGITLSLAAALVLALTGCKTRLTDFTVLSSKNVDFSKKDTFKRGPNRVTGVDEAYIIIFIPTGIPNIKTAIDRAIEGVPGAVALVDGVLYAENWWFIFGANSYIVEGTPLIDPSLVEPAQAMKSNYMVSFYNGTTRQQELKYVDAKTYGALKDHVQRHDTERINEMLSRLN